jgi:predicted DNA-binding ribbon-helix-helix protein
MERRSGGRFEGWQHSQFLRAGAFAMKSTVVKRSIKIDGHMTSVSLEDPFWFALKEIANGRQISSAELVALINARREQPNLSSAIRVFVLNHFQVNEATGNPPPNAETVHPPESTEEGPSPY